MITWQNIARLTLSSINDPDPLHTMTDIEKKAKSALQISEEMMNVMEQHYDHIKLLERRGEFARALENCYLGLYAHADILFGIEAVGILLASRDLKWAQSLVQKLPESHTVVKKLRSVIDFLSAGHEIASIEFGGTELSFLITGDNWELESTHISGQIFEDDEVRSIIESCPRNGTFIDIGANCGNHSIAVAKLRPDVKVIPIEAEPRAVEILIKNVKANALDNIDLGHIGKAIAVEAGHTVLQWTSSVSSTRPSSDEFGIRVGNITLPELLTPNAFVKLDIEGPELDIIKSSIEEITKRQSLIMIEALHPSLDGLDERLMSLGLTIEREFEMHAGKNLLLKAI